MRRHLTHSAIQLLEEWEQELQAESHGAEQHTSASCRSAALLSLLAILPGLAGSLLAGAGLPDAELLDRAAQTFRQAQVLQAGTEQARRLFLVAAASYAELEEHGYRNPALAANAGNAYLLGGDLSRAILEYRR